ncbi:MAG: phage major capsid protein, partial [Brevundimonas sp.]
MSEQKSATELAAELKGAFETRVDTVKSIAEKALAEAEKGIPMSEAAKELADQAITGMNEAKARVDDLEQKMARRGGDTAEGRKSAGYAYIENDDVKSFMANPQAGRRVGVEMK